MRNKVARRLARLGMAAGVILVLTGCPEDAADIVEVNTTILNFSIAPLPAISFATGDMEIDNLALAAFDTTVTDGFTRELARCAAPDVCDAKNYGFLLFDGDDTDTEWVFGPPQGVSTDTRAPLLSAVAPTGSNSTALFIDPPINEGLGHYFFIISGSLAGLPASTNYTVALVRLGTQVKAELDQNATLIGLPITQRDSLIILSPNPLGDPATVLGVGTAPTNRGDTITILAGANPFILGNGSTTAMGDTDFGIDLNCGTGVLWCSDVAPTSDAALTDSMLFGRNDGVAYTLPRYNFLVMYDCICVPDDGTPVIARWQTGQDMNLAGEVLNNGAAPFPPAPLTLQELIAAPGGAGAPDSISIEVFNAEALASGSAWAVWLMNIDLGTMTAATGTYQEVAIVREIDPITGEIISQVDSVLSTTTDTHTFAGGLRADVGGTPQELKHVMAIGDASLGGGDSPGNYTYVVVSLEASASASAPSDAQTLWFQYTDQSGTPPDFSDDLFLAPGTLAFGTFDSADPTLSTTFGPGNMAQATGLGGLADTPEGIFFNAEITNLPLPPVGWYYEGWLTNPVTGIRFSLGSIAALPPDTTSLFDADIDQDLPSVTPTGIRFSCVCTVVDPDEILTGAGDELTARLTSFFLTLEPKDGGDPKNIADVEVGNIPVGAIISRRQSAN